MQTRRAHHDHSTIVSCRRGRAAVGPSRESNSRLHGPWHADSSSSSRLAPREAAKRHDRRSAFLSVAGIAGLRCTTLIRLIYLEIACFEA